MKRNRSYCYFIAQKQICFILEIKMLNLHSIYTVTGDSQQLPAVPGYSAHQEHLSASLQ